MSNEPYGDDIAFSSVHRLFVLGRTTSLPTIEDVARQPLAERLGRMEPTADDLAAAVRGQSEVALSRRPDAKNWAAKEIICHLRDTEEVFLVLIMGAVRSAACP